ncbi:glycosyltransferase family 2 protein [Pseudonocardia cypriaca]|nr:glycosyltransferase family 2 protein [Pseudonocardia cypriaca]
MIPPLSVCVPAYNSARTIDETLRSILDQDVDCEVVVLDNGSDDGTGDIARSFADSRIRVHRNEVTLHIGANWNRVVELSGGRLTKIVCADDVLWPGSLAAQLDLLRDPAIAIVSSRFDVIDEESAVKESGLGIPGLEGLQSPRALMSTIVRQGPAEFGPTAAAMFRREHFDRVDGLRPDLVFPMDVDLFARVTAFGAFFGMPESTAAWRSSTFNLCSRSSSWSKLSEMLYFHHRLRRDHPEYVHASDVLAGDVRLVRAGLERLRVRSQVAVTTHLVKA